MTTRAKQIRDARQESLRELLSNQGHLQHVIDLAKKIEAIGETLEKGVSVDSEGKQKDIGGLDVQRLAIAIKAKKDVIDTKMKLINKYLGDVKSVEHSGEVTQTVINDRNLLEDMLREKGIDPERIRTH
jgi:hypothetical protein